MTLGRSAALYPFRLLEGSVPGLERISALLDKMGHPDAS